MPNTKKTASKKKAAPAKRAGTGKGGKRAAAKTATAKRAPSGKSRKTRASPAASKAKKTSGEKAITAGPSPQLAALVEGLQADLARKEYVISSMREIGQALSSTLSLEHLLGLIVGKVTDLMEADRSTLFLVDRKTNEIWSLIAQGEGVEEIRLPVGRGIAGTVARVGRTINIPDAYEDDRFNRDVDRQTGYRTKSILCMPIRASDGHILGVIQVLNKKNGAAFTVDDETLLDALCSQMALSLQNAELYADLEKEHVALVVAQRQLENKIAQIDTLYEVEQQISASRGLEDLLEAITTKAMEFLRAEAGSILLLEEGTNQLFFKVALGEKGQEVKDIRLKVGEGIVGWVAQHGEPVLVSDTYVDERFRQDIADKIGFPAKSIICVPLVVEGQTIGALELINKLGNDGEQGVFSQDDAKLLQLVSAQVAKAIHSTRLREREARSERLASIGQMISGLMHDIQTPMTSIVGFVELMSLPDSAADERREFAEIVKSEVDRLTQMIRAHLDFAKGKSDMLLKKLAVGTLVEEMVHFLEKDFQKSKIALRTDLGYRGNVRIDETKMKRAFYNLAKNAKEAMPDGGTLTIGTEQEDGHVVFRFADTGRGIPEEIRHKLFESFVTHGKEDGTGLGLAQVKSAVEQHKGRIDVDSEVGKGTTFTIRLPAGL